MDVFKYWFLAGALMFASAPSSTNIRLQEHGFGNGGTDGSSSSSYELQGISGEQSGEGASTSIQSSTGLVGTQQANVPPAPIFTNDDNWYNKLKLVINTGDNPNDATYLVSISDDSFTTTNYIQSDNTIAPVVGAEDYRTFPSYGGASGIMVIGLDANTTYDVKVLAEQGNFTETGYGPTASAATINPTLTFDIDISTTDSESSPPYAVALNELLPGSPVAANNKIWIDFETNGAQGGDVFVYSQNAGLLSAVSSYTITSANADLAIASEGFGVKSDSATQSSGGPLTAQSPYDGAADQVGVVDSAIRPIYSATSPLVGGRASIVVKAKTTDLTPSASDYTDRLKLIAASKF